MTYRKSLFSSCPPIFVDGIGPPLQQIEQDWRELHDSTVGGITNDGLALIAEIMRLRDALSGIANADTKYPSMPTGFTGDWKVLRDEAQDVLTQDELGVWF